MRWLALAIVVAAASSADARMVRRPRDPAVVEACRTRPSWSEVERCLNKLGRFTIERSLDRARLVRVWIDDPDADDTERKQDAGVYLFLQQKDSTWLIGGMFAERVDYTAISLAQVTIERHVGYRLDMGTLQRTSLALDGAPPVDTVTRTLMSLYCYGNDHRCIDIVTACEVMSSRGKTLLAFHGTLRLERGDLVVDGDPSHAGSVCASTRRIPLGWAEAEN
jgi:hypothetical protein